MDLEQRVKQVYAKHGYFTLASTHPYAVGDKVPPETWSDEWKGIFGQTVWRVIGPSSREERQQFADECGVPFLVTDYKYSYRIEAMD